MPTGGENDRFKQASWCVCPENIGPVGSVIGRLKIKQLAKFVGCKCREST